MIYHQKYLKNAASIFYLNEHKLIMKQENKSILKLTAKILGQELSEVVDGLTLGIPKTIFENYIDRKVAQRLQPALIKKSFEEQKWDSIKLGMSENEVGYYLGLPDRIDTQDIITSLNFKKIRWDYKYGKVENSVFFRSFAFSSDGNLIKDGQSAHNGSIKNLVVAIFCWREEGREIKLTDPRYFEYF